MAQLDAPSFVFALVVLGVAFLAFGTWIDAVDIALSRMSLAYAEDLGEEGRRGSDALARSLESRREASLALLVPRASTQAAGVAALTLATSTWLAGRDLPWYVILLSVAFVVAGAVLICTASLAALLSKERYVWVALRGAPLALRLLRRSSFFAAWGRAGNGASVADSRDARTAVVDELRELVDEVAEGEDPDLDEDDREIIRGVFELGQTRVGEVMVPRGEMVTIHQDAPAQEAVDLFLNSGFSRVPVIGKNSDDVLGVLYLKDVIRRLREGSTGVVVADMMRPAQFVPEMKLADDELRQMQERNSHLALVVDEYGGIAGLVTVEDILEELVGELTDEHDHAQPTPQQVEETVWNVPAAYPLDDLSELLDVKVEDDDVNSVGGLLAKALGKVPLPGDQVQVGPVILRAGDDVGRRRQIQTVVVSVMDANEGDADEPVQ